MNKQEILTKISEKMYLKYESEINDTYVSKEEFLKNLDELYDIIVERYDEEIDEVPLNVYVEQSLEEEFLSDIGKLDLNIDSIDVSDLNEAEQSTYNSYNEKYNNIEKIISKEKGELTPEQKDILAAKNIPLIHSIVKKFSNTGIEYSELLSTGYVGYAKALDTYQKGKNVKFSTYAYRCIKNEILYFLRREKRHRDNDVSLYKPLSTDKNGNIMTVESTVSDTSTGKRSIEEDVEMNETVKILLEVIENHLTPNEAYIIKNRYGLNGTKPKTQKEIADEIDMSQANVSKLEKGINDKIKKIMGSKYKIKRI